MKMVLIDFNKDSDLSNWSVMDDVVMGGQSSGNFSINGAGHLNFYGQVSLENNGGFSSLRYRFDKKKIEDFTKIKLRLKGDGKGYQFRVKSSRYDRHSYIYHFETSGEWQNIEIDLNEMIPRFRGMELDMPNYPGQVMEELAFLIGNKKTESFNLEIDKITLE